MTCIVGLVQDGKVYIGGDSAGVGGYSIISRKDVKVFTKGEFVFGFTGSFRMTQIVQYSFVPPRLIGGDDLMQYMVVAFIPALRQAFKEQGFATSMNGQDFGGVFLVGVKGRLFRIDSDYQVGESHLSFMSVGCGEDIALGAMYASGDITDPEERIKNALAASEQFSAGVRAPFNVVSV